MTGKETPQPKNRGLSRFKRDLAKLGGLFPLGKKESVDPKLSVIPQKNSAISKPQVSPELTASSGPIKQGMDIQVSYTARVQSEGDSFTQESSLSINATGLTREDLALWDQIGGALIKMALPEESQSRALRLHRDLIQQDALKEVDTDRAPQREETRSRLASIGIQVDHAHYAAHTRYAELHPDLEGQELKDKLFEFNPEKPQDR